MDREITVTPIILQLMRVREIDIFLYHKFELKF